MMHLDYTQMAEWFLDRLQTRAARNRVIEEFETDYGSEKAEQFKQRVREVRAERRAKAEAAAIMEGRE